MFDCSIHFHPSQAKLEPTGVNPHMGLHSDGKLQALPANLRKTRVYGDGSSEHSNLFRCYKKFYRTWKTGGKIPQNQPHKRTQWHWLLAVPALVTFLGTQIELFFCRVVQGNQANLMGMFHHRQLTSCLLFYPGNSLVVSIRKDCFQVKSNLLTAFRFTTHMNIMILN